MTRRGDLTSELEALRRELRNVPRVTDDEDAAASTAKAAPPPGDMRAEIERVVREFQDKLNEATDDAEDLVASHPLASVAAAFVLGIVIGGLLSRAR
jgi:ElaB/YqjD/DUF883 family membrane-anchored ribosome-binding protein